MRDNVMDSIGVLANNEKFSDRRSGFVFLLDRVLPNTDSK